jgi:hypothetical protein
MLDLDNTLTDAKQQLTSLDTLVRTLTVQEMFSDKLGRTLNWLSYEPTRVDEGILKSLLLRIPQPIVYVHETDGGDSYDVLRGAKLVETLRELSREFNLTSDLINDPNKRRIRDTRITVVVFRASMSYADAERCAAQCHGDEYDV